jgi:cyclopropane fatty-acyl-phospholipid synthase-like methyltransferase
MHYGYWDKDTRTLRKALQNMNMLVANQANISEGMQILDAGCGVGGTAINLAQNYFANFHGISLSEKQIHSATKNASARPLKGKAVFSVQDFTATNFEDETFDIVYGIESVCHAFEKKDFLLEAFRVLKKGGKLIILDFFHNRPDYNQEDKEILRKWANTWAVEEFEFIDSFVQKSEEVGFTVTENKNITSNIKKSARRLYQCFYPGWVVHQILAFFNKRDKTQEENLWSTYYQYKALKNGLWSYHMVCCIKK